MPKLPKFEDLMKNISEEDNELSFNEYQALCEKTAIYKGRGTIAAVMYNALQIGAEGGEIEGKVAKFYRDGLPKKKNPDGTKSDEEVPMDEWIEDLAKEVGDVLWHIAMLLTEIGFPMEAVATGNLEKLADRANRNVLSGSGDNR
jgi:NTP pyrophosphatase (non-canonical NTP hydrolase)